MMNQNCQFLAHTRALALAIHEYLNGQLINQQGVETSNLELSSFYTDFIQRHKELLDVNTCDRYWDLIQGLLSPVWTADLLPSLLEQAKSLDEHLNQNESM